MKTSLPVSLICLFLYGLVKLSNCQNITNEQKSIVEKQIDSIFQIMVKAAENLEYDKINTGVDDKYNAGFIINGSYFTQYDSLINIVKTNSKGVNNQSILIRKKKITVISDNIVLLTAAGDASIDVRPGNSFAVEFFWSFVYEKINNNWKVIQSHQSTNK